jgi:hypothetical protein
MHYQFAKFVTLILPFYGLGRMPIYPFDTSNGTSNTDLHSVFYHYHPAIQPVMIPTIGYAISHYADNDSRFVCCLSCNDDVYGESPEILIDAVEMGMAAWGGKCMTVEEALRLAKYLQPARQFVQERPSPTGNTQVRVTIPSMSLTAEGILTRAEFTEEIVI